MSSRALIYLCVGVLLTPLLTMGRFSVAAAQGAAQASPAGRWKNIDDKSGKPKSLLVLWEKDGKLYGRIEQILDPAPDNPDHKCIHCAGALKDKELLGMEILWDLKPEGSEWSGGFIFDPDNGKTYKCVVEVQDGGKKLKVRGFIGFSLLGRTQYWYRDESTP